MTGRSDAQSPDVVDLALVRSWLARAVARLTEQESAINALNVFPVPDGDTGTNLLLTLRAAAAELDLVPASTPVSVAVRRLTHGALLGARGNSGVILSQQLRGLRLPPRTVAPRAGALPMTLLPALLTSMAQSGRLAVAHPVDGTMLTVLADAAEAAEAMALTDPHDPRHAVRAAAAAARRSLARTPELLPALAQAGVVDAGGAGIVALLDALVEVLTGEVVAAPVELSAVPQVDRAACEDDGIEVMVLMRMPDDRVGDVRSALVAVGTSVAIVGGDGVWHVHVHVADHDGVDAVLDACRERGSLEDVRTMDLTRSPAHQVQDVLAHARAVIVGVVGEGLVSVVRDHGGVPLVPAQGVRPSVAEVLDVLTRVHDDGVDEIVVLPSDRDSLAAVNSAVALFDRQRRRDVAAAVVATESVVQSLAALAVHDPDRGLAAALSAMDEAAFATASVGVTRATRSGVMSGLTVEAGRYIGVVSGDVAAVGDDLAGVAVDVVQRVITDDSEVLTLVVGAGCEVADVDRLTDMVRERHEHVDIEVIDGGQPAWLLILGVA